MYVATAAVTCAPESILLYIPAGSINQVRTRARGGFRWGVMPGKGDCSASIVPILSLVAGRAARIVRAHGTKIVMSFSHLLTLGFPRFPRTAASVLLVLCLSLG